ncbi:hypothetical protein HK102_005153, partial [Quaeritorhiza haematococci]
MNTNFKLEALVSQLVDRVGIHDTSALPDLCDILNHSIAAASSATSGGSGSGTGTGTGTSGGSGGAGSAREGTSTKRSKSPGRGGSVPRPASPSSAK